MLGQAAVGDRPFKFVERISAAADVDVKLAGRFAFEGGGNFEQVEDAFLALDPSREEHSKRTLPVRRGRQDRREIGRSELATKLKDGPVAAVSEPFDLSLTFGRDAQRCVGRVPPEPAVESANRRLIGPARQKAAGPVRIVQRGHDADALSARSDKHEPVRRTRIDDQHVGPIAEGRPHDRKTVPELIPMEQQAAGIGESLGPVLDGNAPSRTTSRAGCDETAHASAPLALQKSKN